MRQVLIAVLGALLIGWSALPSAATAQTACGDRNEVVVSLRMKFSEEPVSMGLSQDGSVIEVFASPSGSWTIVVTRPSGLACMVAAGESWEELPARFAGTGV